MCFVNSVRLRRNFYFIALLLLPYAGGEISFTSKYQGITVTGLAGSSVNFTWSFSGGVNIVNWGLKKDGADIIDRKLVTLTTSGPVSVTVPSAYIGRVSGSGDVSSGQVIFTLSSLKKSDERFYGCIIRREGSFDSPKFDFVYLSVQEAPQINISSLQASYNEGSFVNISCTGLGTPEPDVKWIRNGKVKSSGKKTALLTFSSVNRADGGQYTCKANNSAWNDENHLTLLVHYKPDGTRITTNAASNTVTQGDSVTLTCHVTAAKPQVSQYRFYLNDTTLVKDSNNNQYTISHVTRSQHNGEYKCVPQNDVGDGPEATLTLIVNVPVQFTVLPQNVTVNETNPIVVSCDASGFPAPSISWKKYILGTAVPKDPNTQRSSRSDAGMYVCTASNGVGQDKTAKVYVTVQYPPTIQQATTSAAKSWIGQTVTLTCVSDGVPTPTLAWYKPDGSQINSVTATQHAVNVKMEVDQDFGGYKCDADNGLTPADYKIVKVQQIKESGSPTIITSAADIEATSLTVKWTAPADDGGSPITAYRVVVLKTGTEIKNENITDPVTTSLPVGGLERDTEYNVKVFARNAVFEGPAREKTVRTKYEGVPAAATIEDLPSEVTDDTITLKWSEPQNNGKEITQYTVYQRIVTDDKPGEWKKLETITDISVREFKVRLERGNVYGFVVTATNKLGESLKEDGKIMRVKASGITPTITLQGKDKVTIVKGNVLYLFCKVEGYPKPLITWKKDGKVIQASINKTDFINYEVKKNDAGNYECEASNSVGTASHTVQVTIQDFSVLHIIYSIVILLLLVIILILIVVLQRMRTRHVTSAKNRDICIGCGGELVMLNTMVTDTDKQSSSLAQSADSRTYTTPSSANYMPLHPSGKGWEINREQVNIIKVIGKGAFSQVAKATVWNIHGKEEYTTVAVKMLKANAPDSDRTDLLAEVELMKKLKPHPHVIKLVGCVTETDPLLVPIEYVPFGDLLGYLRKSRGLKDTYFKDPDVKPQTSLTAEQLMRFAWQVADGMYYLSSRKIIHRDLAARNVLVGEGEKCKVTDFGMARNVHQDDIYTKQSRKGSSVC